MVATRNSGTSAHFSNDPKSHSGQVYPANLSWMHEPLSSLPLPLTKERVTVVTAIPHSQWTIQPLRETLAFDKTAQYIIRDNDKTFSDDFK
jgi:hypothetical protein